MGYKTTSKNIERESRIKNALESLNKAQFLTVNAAARHFKVNRATLQNRLNGKQSRAQAHQSSQILNNAEESTLVRWIKQYTIAGHPITPALLMELAQLLRLKRVRRASSTSTASPTLSKIGHEWIYRFLQRHPTINSIYARQMDALRYNGASFEVVKRWFDAVAEKYQEHGYKLQNMWNMDESGLGIGESQSTKVLVPVDYNQTNKMVAGKQEWVTDIECINAAGKALDPLIIWKAKEINSGWIPHNTPKTWHFGCSENGWTSNEMGLQWLKTVFEPQSRAIALKDVASSDEHTPIPRRLLIADGHRSHIRADFIVYCMENNIDLLIMPPHCSHLLQPLDLGVFAAFKRAHAAETDAVSMLSIQHIYRAEWIEIFQKARAKAVIHSNILAGWKGADLFSSDPKKVLD